MFAARHFAWGSTSLFVFRNRRAGPLLFRGVAAVLMFSWREGQCVQASGAVATPLGRPFFSSPKFALVGPLRWSEGSFAPKRRHRREQSGHCNATIPLPYLQPA